MKKTGKVKKLLTLLLAGMLTVGAVNMHAFAADYMTSEAAVELSEDRAVDDSSAEEVPAVEPADEESGDSAADCETADAAGEEMDESYKVILDANGGFFVNEWDDVLNESVESTEILNINIPAGEPVRTFPVFQTDDQISLSQDDFRDMVFAGWSLESEGTLVSQGYEDYVPVESCTLYAVWTTDGSAETGGADLDPAISEPEDENADGSFNEGLEGEENQEESADESFNEGSEVEENQDDSPVTDPYEDGASDNPGQIVENSEEDRPAENMPESNQEEEPPGSAEDKDQGIPESTDHGDNSKDNDAAAGVGPARDAAENNTMDAAAGEVETVESEDEESVSETAKNDSLIASGIINSSIYWELYDDDSLYISGKGAIPDFEDSIAPWSYYSIDSIIIDDGITRVGAYSFYGCYAKDVYLSRTLKSIGKYAFCGNYFDCVYFSDGVTTIGEGAFESSEKMTTLYLPETLTAIGDYAFYECGNLENIYIPDSVVKIGIAAFRECSNLKYVDIGSGLITIEDFAFYACTHLEEVFVDYDSKLKTIKFAAFDECTRLRRINLPESVTKIDKYNFGGKNTIIECMYDSYAMNYAIRHKIKFEAFGFVKVNKATVTGLSARTYTGSAIRPVPTVKLGITKLRRGQDYTLSYKNNVKTGTATIIITGCGEYGGRLTRTFTIKRRSITKASVNNVHNKIWTGKARGQSPVVKLGSKTLKRGTDYKIKYTNNKNVGSAKITITGIGNYKGSIAKEFFVIPRGTSFISLKRGNGSLTLKWKKQNVQMSAYQIQLSSRKDFKTQKTVIAGSSTVSKTIKGLEWNHLYYVRIRTYKTVGGTRLYSGWSAVKSIRTGSSLAPVHTQSRAVPSYIGNTDLADTALSRSENLR